MKRLLAALLIAAMLGGCTKVGTSTSGAGHTHVLRYATSEDLVGLNPWLNQQSTLSLMASLTMAWLIKWDHNNRPIPELATEVPTEANGGISKDGLTVTYHLRKGVVWSDGQPFNADDVVWSTNAVNNPANNVVSRSGWDLISKLDEPDKYTVVFHLKKRFAPFIATFFSSAGANPCVLPKHILASLPNINQAPYNALPIGIGPFKYQEWKRGDHVTMVPNPKYFRGTPKLKEVVFKLIPNRDTVWQELAAGDIDMWYPVPGLYMSRFSELGSGFSSMRNPAYGFNHMDFNITRPRVKELAVRQALRYALDRDELLKKIGHGSGVVQESPISDAAPYAVHDVPLTPFDINKANGILDQAGWKRDPDGIRSKGGVRLTLDVASSAGSQDVDQMLELIRANWKKIGVAMNINHYQSSLLFATYQQGGIIYAGKFDVVFFAWNLDPIGDLSVLYACDQIPPKGQNDPHWCNQKADAAMTQFKQTYDEKKRQPFENAVIHELVNDVPTIVTKVNMDNFIFKNTLTGFHPNQVSWFDDFMNVDI